MTATTPPKKKPAAKRAPRKAPAATVTESPAETHVVDAPVPTPALTDELQMELTAVLPNGVIVPSTLTLVYPQGMGFHTVKGLQKLLTEQVTTFYQELLNRQDASTVQVLAEAQAAQEAAAND